jgi:hypothetical protein
LPGVLQKRRHLPRSLGAFASGSFFSQKAVLSYEP